MRLTMLIPLLLAVGACHARAPYEGKSVARLQQMLRDPNPTVQAQGAYGLSRLGPEARDAVPALIEAMKGETLVRENAALALGQIGPEAREAVPTLIEVLNDPEWTVRRHAAIALGEIGPDAMQAVRNLEKLRKDPDRLVRRAAEEALAKIRAALRKTP
jgi:HEAT repeat protein